MDHGTMIRSLKEHVDTVMVGDTSLQGYAARFAANELLGNWKEALTDGNTDDLVADIDDVIRRLQAFKAQAQATLPYVNGGHNPKAVEWEMRLATLGIVVGESVEEGGWSFKGSIANGCRTRRQAVWAAVEQYLPDGGYALDSRQMAQARYAKLAQPIAATGWLLLADRNTFGNVVHLVSVSRDFAVAFRSKEPYHDYLRVQARAEGFAHAHKETATESVLG